MESSNIIIAEPSSVEIQGGETGGGLRGETGGELSDITSLEVTEASWTIPDVWGEDSSLLMSISREGLLL